MSYSSWSAACAGSMRTSWSSGRCRLPSREPIAWLPPAMASYRLPEIAVSSSAWVRRPASASSSSSSSARSLALSISSSWKRRKSTRCAASRRRFSSSSMSRRAPSSTPYAPAVPAASSSVPA